MTLWTKHNLVSRGGKWKLAEYVVNDIDSTELINYNSNDNYKKITFELIKAKTKEYWVLINTRNFHMEIEGDSFVFNGQSGYSKICPGPAFPFLDGCYKLIFTPETSVYRWKINKLSKNEIIISAGGINNYILKFRR